METVASKKGSARSVPSQRGVLGGTAWRRVKEPRDRIRYRTQGLLVPDREREREKERGWGRDRERRTKGARKWEHGQADSPPPCPSRLIGGKSLNQLDLNRWIRIERARFRVPPLFSLSLSFSISLFSVFLFLPDTCVQIRHSRIVLMVVVMVVPHGSRQLFKLQGISSASAAF